MTHMDQYIIPAGNGAEAAPGVERLDVKAVNRKQDRSLYAGREKVYPKLAHGRFRTVKWLVMAVTLGIYYALPWLRWHRGPGPARPGRAARHGATTASSFSSSRSGRRSSTSSPGCWCWRALALFLVTSAAGRVWCGYTCPQTVWTDLMILVERFWQGDRNARMRLDKERWGPVKLFKKGMTHLSWLAIGVATGGAFIFYFRDAPTLAAELLAGTAPAIAYLFLGIFTLTTYVLGGIAREQVCIYMCPWPRIQGAMVDHETLLVSYKGYRGEPRGPHKKGQPWEGRGDCIDCKACVAVCPTGIDIRDGSQLECIQCALCIDACNDIMDKVGRPRGLIGYDTIAKQEAAAKGTQRAAAARACAHACSMRASSAWSAPSCWRLCSTARRSRSTCCTTATRPSCCCPTAASATATPSRSSTSCTSRANSLSRCAALPARSWPSSAWSRARRSASPPTICARCACSSPCRARSWRGSPRP